MQTTWTLMWVRQKNRELSFFRLVKVQMFFLRYKSCEDETVTIGARLVMSDIDLSVCPSFVTISQVDECLFEHGRNNAK